MAKCEDCEQEMLEAQSCTHEYLITSEDGKELVVWARETAYFDHNDRCHDCGIENKVGNVHHWGCDMEKCPICGCQLLSCDCMDGFQVWTGRKGKSLSD